MNSEIFVIDSFYDIPFEYHKSFLNNEVRITEETTGKISSILQSDIKIIEADNNIQKEEDVGRITAHLSSDWIAVVYLQLGYPSFGEFGMKFFSHNETGLESYVDGKQFNVQDKTQWKEYGKIPARYNRLVLFRSNRWHSYGKGFGNDLNTSMLYQKMIING